MDKIRAYEIFHCVQERYYLLQQSTLKEKPHVIKYPSSFNLTHLYIVKK